MSKRQIVSYRCKYCRHRWEQAKENEAAPSLVLRGLGSGISQQDSHVVTV